MLEEKLIREELNGIKEFFPEIISKFKNERKNLQEILFQKIIHLIDNKKFFMLGPEKTKTATFITKYYLDVLKILENQLKSEKKERET